MSSLIKKQDVIDELLRDKEFLMRVLDDTNIVGQSREQYSWLLKMIESYINVIEKMTSTEPDIIKCKDCRHHHYDIFSIPYCDRIDYGYGWEDNDFCSKVERKEDE